MALTAVRKFRVAPAPADPYGDAVAGFIYPKVEALEVSAEIDQMVRNFMVSDLQKFLHAAGGKLGSVKFATELIGFGGAVAGAGTGITATDGENGLLFKACWGSQTLDSGRALTSMTTTTATCTVDANGFTIGGFIGFIGADGLFYVRQVRSKAGTVITFAPPLPAAAGTASAVAYASNWFKKADTGHQLIWIDSESTAWRRQLRGCAGNFKLKNTAARGRVVIDWEFTPVDWNDPAVGQPAPTYPTNLPLQGAIVRNARVNIFPSGGANQSVLCSEFEFDLGNEIAMKLATSGANGWAQPYVKDSKRTFKIKCDWDDYGAIIFAAFKAKTYCDVVVEMPQGAQGNSFGLAMPVCEITSVKHVEVNGLDYADVEFAIARADTNAALNAAVPDVAFGIL